MDTTTEHQDDGLRDRIRKGFEASATRKSKKIEDRPKTPRRINKVKRSVIITEKPKSQKKIKMEKKPVVRKPKTKSEVLNAMEKLTLIQTSISSNKAVKPVHVYMCPSCDKTYKSKNGIVKHMEKCKSNEQGKIPFDSKH
jgi:hypothetical protein